MQQKFIVIGVAVVVALAAISGGVALVANSNNDNGNSEDIKIPDVSGKWNLAYVELANMCTEEGVAITEASEVDIIECHVNPYESIATLDITKVGDHGFTGKYDYDGVSDIHGTVNGPAIEFALSSDGMAYKYEAVVKDDYMSCSLTMRMLPGEGEDHFIITGVAYMLFIRDGCDPVPIRSDYFDMSIMKVGNPIRGVLHKVTDFTEGDKTGRGTDLVGKLAFNKSHSMISVFDMYDEKNDKIGVLANVLLGTSPRGTVSGCTAGNMDPLVEGGVNTTFSGHMVIGSGKAVFMQYVYYDSTVGPEFLEIEYNVPYRGGGDMSPVHLSEKYDYKGTISKKEKDKEPLTNEISVRFTMTDNTICVVQGEEGKEIIWFGEIYGHHFELFVVNKDLGEVGFLTGHVYDDKIHLYGVMHGLNSKEPFFLEINLELSKA